MNKIIKGLAMSRLLITHPLEFLDRIEIQRQKRNQARHQKTGAREPYAKPCSMEQGILALSGVLDRDLTSILGEPELADMQPRISSSIRNLESVPNLPFPIIFNADPTLAQLCYALCRALRPDTVLETGVRNM
jgi:hypothetical protein